MRPVVILFLVAVAAPAFAQAPREETRPTAPPAVRLEARPETMDGFPMIMCPRQDAQPPEQQSGQAADKQAGKTERPDGCRLVPPKRERHPDYGKGKFYDLTPA